MSEQINENLSPPELPSVETPMEEPVATDTETVPPITVPSRRRLNRLRFRLSPARTILAVFLLLILLVGSFLGLKDAQDNRNRARARFAQGQSALLDGDYYRALYEYTIALKYYPKLRGAHLALGRIAIYNRQGDEAIRHFRAELELNPEDRESRLALGCIYTLECVPADDPYQVVAYLLGRFGDVLPYDWPDSLDFAADPSNPSTDSLTEAIVQFQSVLEKLPADPAPVIGTALTDIAINNLTGARERLSKLTNFVEDESFLPVIQSIIEDINREEQYRMLASGGGQQGLPDFTTPLVEPTPSDMTGSGLVSAPPPQDLSGVLGMLPPLPGNEGMVSLSPSPSVPPTGGFGSRGPLPGASSGPGNNLGLALDREKITPHPTVKPITRDIFLQETGEAMKTNRLANIYSTGDIGFEVGKPVIMPFTGTEITVMEETPDRIVLQERGYIFTFRKSTVGWDLVPEEDESILPDVEADGTAVNEGESTEGGTNSPDEEMGPEVGN